MISTEIALWKKVTLTTKSAEDRIPLRPGQARVVGAATVAEGTAEYTRYSVEVTPADEGEAWTVHHRFKDFMALRSALTALVGPGGLPQCWADVSKARSVTGRHRCASRSAFFISW